MAIKYLFFCSYQSKSSILRCIVRSALYSAALKVFTKITDYLFSAIYHTLHELNNSFVVRSLG